jgi:peptide methionine sulfoxide reductase MsrA
LIDLLKAKGFAVVTELAPAKTFWAAEDYHQDYLTKNPGRYDCHVRVERFGPASKLADPLR